MIFKYIDRLISYGVKTNLLDEREQLYARNRLLTRLKLDTYSPTNEVCEDIAELPQILDGLLSYALEKGILESDSIIHKDIFDTEIMDIITPRPAQVIDKFYDLYKESSKKATDYFYDLSRNSNYIRRDRIKKDIKWTVESDYGQIEMTINCSKPEKDPKAIALLKDAPKSDYPACQLCIENEGYGGRMDHPARQNHRIIPINICGEKWAFQFSPYVYYDEHCIVFNAKHTPMTIDSKVFLKLLDFVSQFNHYVVGSNADLPIVGGSILTHEHFQGGNHIFPMQKAESEKFYKIKGFEDVEVSRVKWPLSVIRLKSDSKEKIAELSAKILSSWREYTDEDAFIYSETQGVRHNTITPIANMTDGKYVMDLALRNNITTDEHPAGVYHPHKEHHHIKRENIGLIEVMGLAVLPARLVEELSLVEKAILDGSDMSLDEKTALHKDWAEEIKEKYDDLSGENIREIILEEVGKVFVNALEHSGVYKRTKEGMEAFDRFMNQL